MLLPQQVDPDAAPPPNLTYNRPGLAENVEIDILYKSKGQKRKRMKRNMRNYGGVRSGSACSDKSIKNRTLGDSKKFAPSSSVTERLCDCYSLETPFALLQVEK